MTVAATGVRAVAAGKLATMVSQSATFISRTSALNAAGALLHIHYPDLRKNNAKLRPCAIITAKRVHMVLNSDGTYVADGSIELRLLDTARQDDKADAIDDFTNFADGVLADLWEISRTNTTGLLTIQDATDEGVGMADERENSEWANHYATLITIEWAPFQG